MKTKIVGDFGENLTAFLLEQQFGAAGLTIIRVANENLPYDLLVPVASGPFKRPATITVKTRGNSSDVIPPTRERLGTETANLSRSGFQHWISFVHYVLNDIELAFGVYILPSAQLNKTKDFRKVTRGKGNVYQIDTEVLKGMASLKYFSRGYTQGRAG